MTEEQIFLAVLDLPDPADRTAYLDRACGNDAEFRRQVEELLAAHFNTGAFLDEPLARQMAAGAVTPFNDNTVSLYADPGGYAVPDEKMPDEEPDDLRFLQPSTRADSLGRIGHYEVLELLGKGGFGIVLRAFDEVLQRVVALKVLAPAIASTSPARKRFLREARSSALVRHENVVQVHAIEEQPVPYLEMEYIPGETLQQRLDRIGPLEVTEIARLGRQIAEGLAAAHATGLIHRDVKPGNILIEKGSQERVKITDFGLARAADDASMTQSGLLAGTPMYMAPEQARSEALDHRADLFSLGSVLYVMATGRPPFRAATTYAVLKRVVEDTPRPIREVIPELPQWLADIIAKLHAKKPEDRFQSAREVADLLVDCEARLKAKPEVKNVLPAAKPAAPSASGGRKWVAAAAVLLLPVIALTVTEFAGVTHLFRRQATTEPSKPGGDPTPVVDVKKETPVPEAKSEPPPLAVAPFTDADVQRIAALPAAEQIEEVRKELRRRNPGFDGMLKPTIKDGVVTELAFLTDEVDNIAPVRALMGLTTLTCTSQSRGKLSDISPLKSMPLISLNLDSCSQVQDLSPLKGMPLKVLLFYSTSVTDLKPLQGMELVEIHLTPKNITQGLDILRDMKSLKTIGIDHTQFWAAAEFWERYDKGEFGLAPFTDADARRIAALPAAEQVEEVRKELVRRNPGFDGKVEHKIEDGVVTVVRIVTDKVTDVAPIRVFNALRVLDLFGSHINFKGNGQLADLSPLKGMNLAGLTRLNLNWTMVGDEGLAHFRDCKQLTFLGLDTTQVSDTGLAYFKDYTKLTHLELSRLKISDAGLAHFKDCKNLTLLQLGGSPVGDAGLSYFKECENMTVLGLARTRVTDAGLAYFKDCKKLANLGLMGTQVTDVGLAHFKDCKELTRLHIGFTKVADLSLIKGMPLKELDCTFRPERDAEILRSIKTLDKINGKPAAEFWERYDKGEFGPTPFTDADARRIAASRRGREVGQRLPL